MYSGRGVTSWNTYCLLFGFLSRKLNTNFQLSLGVLFTPTQTFTDFPSCRPSLSNEIINEKSGNFAACTFRNSFLFFISPYFRFFFSGGGGATQKRGGIPFPRQGQKDMTSAWRFKGFPSASFSCRDHWQECVSLSEVPNCQSYMRGGYFSGSHEGK